MNIEKFEKLPVMGILRGVRLEIIEPLFLSVIKSGLKTIEITMNTPDAEILIKKAIEVSAGELMIGAGTVLTKDSMMKALDAGASFIVMPTLVSEIMDYCVQNNIPVFPGAFTPQEIWNAWNSGASMVKVFPSKFFGPEYFKEIKGPFDKIKLLACGGVKSENISQFFECGADAVAFGGSVFKKEWLESGDFESIEESIKQLVNGG